MKCKILLDIILACTLLLVSCIREELVYQPEESGRITIPVLTVQGHYETPVSRAGVADENFIGKTPWVLVFRGSGEAAVFYEVEQAHVIGNKSYVTLDPYSSTVRILVIANAPASFSNGTLDYPFSKENLSAQLQNVSFADAVNGILLTTSLSSPYNTGVPYTPGQTLPMSNVLDLPKIDQNVTIGTTASKLMLTRIVAKVTVTNDDTGFDLDGATITGAPRNGRLYQSGPSLKVNTGNQTYYTGGDGISGVSPATGQSTAANPIYVYESRASEGTCVIVKGTYNSKIYYYKLEFNDSGSIPMDIVRNNLYEFTINQIKGPGYASLTDAMANPANNVEYTVTVTDLGSFEIADNGNYYLGVSNSLFFQFYPMDEPAVAMDDIVVATVYTNAPTSLTTKSITLSGGNGKISLLTTSINTTGTVAATDIRVNLQNGFTGAIITVSLGTLTKTIQLIGTNCSTGGGITYYGNMTTAKVESFGNGPQGWIQLKYGDDAFSDHLDLSAPATVGMYVNPNESNQVRRNGIVYMSFHSGRRYKFNIIQGGVY